MHPDIVDLQEFYASPLGGMVRRILSHRIRMRWRSIEGETVIGLGYASPYLSAFRGEARRIAAFMPGPQGAALWPGTGPSQTVLVEDDRLPLADNSVGRMLAVHSLEAADNDRLLLREIWRVLAPEGRLLMVVPNRRGVWAWRETTPFGHGRPYSPRQLDRLLTEALFTPIDWGMALYMLPIDRRLLVRSATAWERVGARTWPAFAGVNIVEARKEMIAPLGTGVTARRMGQLITVSR